MAEVTVQNLLEAGVHFGHQTRRWNPKMKKFIFTERNGIYIIDLQKTLNQLNKARKAIREITAKGEYVLFVGTKPQAASIILEESERCSQYFVVNRWAGGMLTNYRTIRQSIKRLDHLEQMETNGTYEHLTKKEILNVEKQRGKLSWLLEGIRHMNRLPGLLIVIDTKKEKLAVNEANRLGIPVCAILDTNCDPDPITYPIPGNDDAIRSIKVLLSSLTDSVIEGQQMFADKEVVEEKQKAVADAEKADQDRKKHGRRQPQGRRRDGGDTKGGRKAGAAGGPSDRKPRTSSRKAAADDKGRKTDNKSDVKKNAPAAAENKAKGDAQKEAKPVADKASASDEKKSE